jgi:hypothetical protein
MAEVMVLGNQSNRIERKERKKRKNSGARVEANAQPTGLLLWTFVI